MPEQRRRAEQDLPGDEWWGNDGLLSAIGNDVVNGIVATGSDGAIRWVNPAFLRLTGYASSELAGKTPQSLQSAIHVPDFYQELGRAIEAGVTRHAEVWIRAKDGSEFLQEATITPAPDGCGETRQFVAVLGRPIVGHYDSEPELRSDDQLADLALTLSNQGLWEWNLVTGKDYLSPAFCRLLGYHPGETKGGFCGGFRLIHSDDLGVASESLLAHLGGLTPRYEAAVRLRKANGEYLRVVTRGRVTKWDNSGLPCQIAGIHSDAGVGTRLEQELRDTEELGKLGLKADRIVHDLNNMLTVTIAYGKLLEDDTQIPESFKENLRTMVEASERGAGLIRSLLSFKRSNARADSGTEQASDNQGDSVEVVESGKGSRILVVEESGFVRQTLTTAGFQVLAAKNGKEALSLAHEGVALAITDLMPSKEAIALMVELRRHHPFLPVIAISNEPVSLYVRIALALGVNATLSKPLSAEQLIETVGAVLRGGQPGDCSHEGPR